MNFLTPHESSMNLSQISSIGTAQDFSELRQTIDDAFTKLEELEEEGRRSKLIDTIHCSPARFVLVNCPTR